VTGPDAEAEAQEEPTAPEPEWKRRRRLAEVFGDALPDTTADERDPAEGAGRGETWLKDQVPPHHGG
jgi:hypothetical protein